MVVLDWKPSYGRRDGVATWASLGVFIACLAFVGARHEPWFDEAQAWLMARDLPLWTLLTREVRYEGSPGLWHAILWAVQRLGFPYSGLWLISSTFAAAGAAVVLRKAPFPAWLRIACVFSYFFGFQYAIVARSYALALLLVPLAAAMYLERTRRPVGYVLALGLLANCNAHGFIVAGVLFVEFVYASWKTRLECGRRPFLAACATYLAMAAAAAYQARPAADGSFLASAPADILLHPSFQLADAFMDRLNLLLSGVEPHGQLLETAIVMVLLGPCILLFWRARTFPLFAALLFSLVIFSMAEYANAWHAGFIWLAWLFCLWISWGILSSYARGQRAFLIVSVAALAAVQTVDLAVAWIREIETPYSSGPAAAAAIASFVAQHQNARVAAVGFKAFSVQPWFASNVFADYDGGALEPAYFQWKRSNHYRPDTNIQAWRTLASDQSYGALVLSPFAIPHASSLDAFVDVAEAHDFCLVATEKGGLIWRAAVMENDDLMIFEKSPRGCAPPSAP